MEVGVTEAEAELWARLSSPNGDARDLTAPERVALLAAMEEEAAADLELQTGHALLPTSQTAAAKTAYKMGLEALVAARRIAQCRIEAGHPSFLDLRNRRDLRHRLVEAWRALTTGQYVQAGRGPQAAGGAAARGAAGAAVGAGAEGLGDPEPQQQQQQPPPAQQQQPLPQFQPLPPQQFQPLQQPQAQQHEPMFGRLPLLQQPARRTMQSALDKHPPSTSYGLGPLASLVTAENSFAEAAESMPFLAQLAEQVGVKLATRDLASFKRKAGDMAEQLQSAASQLQRVEASLADDDVDGRQRCLRMQLDLLQKANATQKANLMVSNVASSSLMPFKETLDILGRSDSAPEKILLLGLANLTPTQRTAFLGGATAGAAGGQARLQQQAFPQQPRGCYYCGSTVHGFRRCDAFAAFGVTHPAAHKALEADYLRGRPPPMLEM